VLPMVMIIFDTSGSMSYIQNTASTPVCSTGIEKDPDVTYTFSRDMIAKEVLTGTFKDFWCQELARPATRYDAGYPIPWFVPKFSTQVADGILDDNGEFLKFALLTFDTKVQSEVDAVGQYSLGPNYASLLGIGPTNLGIQSELAVAGKLVIPAASDVAETVATSNTAVQDEIMSAIPFGGTPISPSLADTLWLIKNHGNLIKKTAGNNGDPYANCRTKNVLLITDGLPNIGEAQLGYKTSVLAAEDLFKAGYKVYVVGFNLDDTSLTQINEIAEAGGTTEAYIASSKAQLSTSLSAILGKATPGIHSRTRSAVTNITNSGTELQYQINAAYQDSPTSDIDYRGYFEVTSYECSDECRTSKGGAGACTVYDGRAKVQTQSTRDLRFVFDGKQYAFKTDTPELTADVLGIPTSGDIFDVVAITRNDILTVNTGNTVDASDAAKREEVANRVISMVRGDAGTRRAKEKLGGILHTTPVIQENLSSLNVPIKSFQRYQQNIKLRPTMTYTATNEGFVHAFHLSQPDAASSYTWMQEIWGIAPQHVTANMWKLVTKRKELIDGRITLKDIRIRKDSTVLTLDQEAALWRSILVVPYRQGGRGMTAIDVTDPFDPWIRWEIDNTRHCWADGDTKTSLRKCKPFDAAEQHDYRRLGLTNAKPKVGTVFITDPSSSADSEVAAVFYPCGRAIAGEAESGKCFMVTRLDNGFKIKEFRNGDGSVKDASTVIDNVADTLEFPVVGDPAVYNTFIGTFVTRLFVGDAGGQLWRMDTASKDPTKWKMTFFFDLYDDLLTLPLSSPKRSALRTAPALAPVPKRGQLVLAFAAGDLDFTNGSADAISVVYSIKETVASGGAVTSTVNWKRRMTTTENVTSAPLIFGRTVYWTSFETDINDACDGGIGRIWGVDFLKADLDQKPIPALDKDGDPGTAGDIVEFIELEDSVPFGLTLVVRPSCAGSSGIGAAAGNTAGTTGTGAGALKASKPGALQLVVQTGNKGKTSPSSKPGKTGSKSPTVNTFAKDLAPKKPSVISVSWGRVQNL